MATEEKKGITVKIDAALHAQIRQYIEQHGMTMAEFVTRALENELHPKFQEEKTMENMRTLAFQVPESLFQRIKGYLQRNNMTQKQFVIGLIETELEREQNECESMDEDQEESIAEVGGEDTEEAANEVEPDLEEENDMAAENAEEVSGDRDQEDTDIAEDEEMEADSSDEVFDTEDEEAEGLSMCI